MTIATEVLARATPARTMGSSWRMRRLVLAGRIVFDPVAQARPAMTRRETELFCELVKASTSMLEFGAGGSTARALKLGIERLVSVESDQAWIDRILLHPAAFRAQRDGRLKLVHADIGEISQLGAPANEGAREAWPDYARMPWPCIDADRLDFVFIDGRFRVACILESILRAGPNARLAVHDFWNRPHYHRVLPFLDTIDRVETLGVFQIKGGVDRKRATALLADASYDPR